MTAAACMALWSLKNYVTVSYCILRTSFPCTPPSISALVKNNCDLDLGVDACTPEYIVFGVPHGTDKFVCPITQIFFN
jgi:hypothetical protein